MGSAYFDAHSLWQRSDKPLFTSLTQDANADVCIIGAGIAGLSAAYALAREGQMVIVLDRERVGLGETGLTSAHLSYAIDARYHNLERWHGMDGARLAYESHAAAIDFIELACMRENINCDFERVDGYLFLDPETPHEELIREKEACHRAGVPGVKLLAKAPAFFDSGACLLFPQQAQFHPLKYIDGLATAAKNLGVCIFTHTEVQEVRGGYPARVRTSQGLTVTADAVIVATDAPFNNRVTLHAKNAAYRTYVVGVPAGDLDITTPALFWDTGDPYHYIRFVRDPGTEETILLVGGEDHRTGQDTDSERHFDRLLQWIGDRFGIHSRPITRWSGQVIESLDGLAYIGRNPGDFENVFVVTGDCGQGLTHGTIAGLLLRDQILGRENPWATLYDPARLHLRDLGALAADVVSSVMPYGDWFAESEVKSVSQIENGEGAIVRDGLSKIAVYKDELGRLHSCSAACTHLGGMVHWNSAEKTWDCPCHGSRFDRFGQVVNGPATKELEPVRDPRAANELPAAEV